MHRCKAYWEQIAHTTVTRLTRPGFENFFKFYKGEPQQKAAIEILFNSMPVSLLEDDTPWVKKYREAPPAKPSNIPQAAVDLIKEFEGFRSEPYDDGIGVATIGYGATFYADNTKVTLNDPPISEGQGEELLKFHLEYFWGMQESSIPFFSQMKEGQKGCLLSFSFNCGAGFYGNSGFNTLTYCLSEQRWDDVPDALRLYVNPGSPVEEGLRRRREAEIELWLSE